MRTASGMASPLIHRLRLHETFLRFEEGRQAEIRPIPQDLTISNTRISACAKGSSLNGYAPRDAAYSSGD